MPAPLKKSTFRTRFKRMRRTAKRTVTKEFRVKQHVGQFTAATNITTVGVTGSQCSVYRSSITAPNGGAFAFVLNDLPQIATYAALFDQYKIEEILLKFKPRLNSADRVTDTALSSTSIAEELYYCIDYDDSNVPTSLDEVREFDTCRNKSFYQSFNIRIKPKIAMAAYGSGAFTSYASMTNQWLDVASPAIAHYGVKFVTSPTIATAHQIWDITAVN